jgi:hypothetical protein
LPSWPLPPRYRHHQRRRDVATAAAAAPPPPQPHSAAAIFTTDYRTIENFAPLEGIFAPKGRKSLPEVQKSFLAVDLVILY